MGLFMDVGCDTGGFNRYEIISVLIGLIPANITEDSPVRRLIWTVANLFRGPKFLARVLHFVFAEPM